MNDNKNLKKHNPHIGHRKRLRKRFIEDGSLDNFEYHQILELLLFYVIKIQDTNKLAHKILEKYNSFYDLLNASPKDIMKKCNLSENTAMLISALPHIFKKYMESKSTITKVIDSSKAAYEYFNTNIKKHENKRIYIICLDSNKRLIRMVNIGKNSPDFTNCTRKIIDVVLQCKCVYVIVGYSIFEKKGKLSKENVNRANFLKKCLNKIGVTLTDYIILYDDFYYSFADKQLCGLSYLF